MEALKAELETAKSASSENGNEAAVLKAEKEKAMLMAQFNSDHHFTPKTT